MTALAPVGEGAGEPSAFSTRTVLIMLIVGVLSAIGFGVVATFAPDLRSDGDGGAHALSRSAVGYAGLVQLLRARGVPVVVSRGLPRGPMQRRGLLVLTPTAAGARDQVQALAKRYVNTLIVSPKWLAFQDPRRPGWVRRFGLLPPIAVGRLLPDKSGAQLRRRNGERRPILSAGFGPFSAGARLKPGPIRELQTLVDGGDAWITAEDGSAVLVNPPKSQGLILSEPDLLNNHGLASLDTARAAMTLIDGLREGGPVVFDVTLNGYERSRSIWKLALTPPFLGGTLCALAAALLMGGHAAVRFGPTLRPQRSIALGKAALADNAAALIALARREPAMAPRYAALTRRAIAKAVAVQRGLTPAQEDAALDRLARPGEAPLSALIGQAEGVAAVDDLRRLAARLYERRMEMTRERR